MAANFWDGWDTIIRSCLLTSKSAMTFHELNRDIRMLEGSNIPYSKFQCKSLDEMLRKIPGLKVFQQGGNVVVQVIPTEETAHIAKMVRAQKSSKKKRTPLPRYSNYRYPPNYNTNYNRGSYNYNYKNSAPNRFNVSNTRTDSPTMKQSSFTQPQQKQSSFTQSSQKQSFTQSPQKQSFTQSPQKQSTPMSPTVQSGVQQVRPTTPPSKTIPSATTGSKNISFASAQEARKVSSTPLSSVHSRLSTPTPTSAQQRLNTASTVQQRLALASSQTVHQPNHSGTGPTSTPTNQPTTLPSLSQRLTAAQTSSRIVPSSLADDPRLRLQKYALDRNLPDPEYKDIPDKHQKIYSSVTVNKKKYSSYPQEAKTKEEAEKFAAQAALDELINEDRKVDIITNDPYLITERILDIVNKHPNGVFESNVIQLYMDKFNEGLPHDWLKIIEYSVVIDITATNISILSPRVENIREISRSTSPTTPFEPSRLKLDQLSEFWLHVYVVYSTTDIWGVIIDENHSDKIEELAREMKSHYSTNSTRSSDVVAGKYYAVLDEGWHRVRCIKVEQSLATVFFIDRGDEDVFPVEKMRSLPQKFCSLPAQSVHISIAGLEILKDSVETQKILEDSLVEKDVYVQNLSIGDRLSSTISAQLTLEVENENMIVNYDILRNIFDPKINMTPDKVAQQVHISFIGDEEIFVQVKSSGLQYLKEFMDNLIQDYLNNTFYKTKPVLRLELSEKLYVSKNTDNNWCRTKIVKILNENEVEVRAVDYGHKFIVKKQNLVLLEDMSKSLANYPEQALEVRLHKISSIMFDKRMSAHFREIAPKSDVFYMKVVGNREKYPRVEFYKRTENNYLASLNDTLALEPEITSKDDNNNAKPRLRNERSSIGARSEFPLKAPLIPQIGEYFDVYVTMAAHPGNFTIQPFHSTNQLEKLMTELSRVCSTYHGPSLTPGSVKVGDMYAAKYDDGKWYRAYVSRVISRTDSVVYFCDYGDYKPVSIEQLQPLQNQFYDLPYQAIKARLHGVSPKLKGDWAVKDSIRFNELAVTKSLVSIIKSHDVNNLSSGEAILSLELIDTSTQEDINITDVLVQEQRADRLNGTKV